MTEPSNPHAEAAVQYLVWALEEMEKSGNPKAAQHARRALDALRKGPPAVQVASSLLDKWLSGTDA